MRPCQEIKKYHIIEMIMICAAFLALNLLVDKFHGLPINYVPTDLVKVETTYIRKEAANQLLIMQKAMADKKLFVSINSGYRPVADQLLLSTLGNMRAAQPGHSEHQLGTAIDFNLEYPSAEWTWLDQNAHKYGFVMSYRYSQTTLSGYNFEPWHWRYVGTDLATKIRYSSRLPQSFYKPAVCS